MLTALRNARQTLNISWSNPLDLNFSNDKLSKYFDLISKIIKAKQVRVDLSSVKPCQTIVFDDFQIVIPLEGLVDISKLQENINKKIDKISKDMAVLNSRLNSESFVANASPEKIQETQNAIDSFNLEIALYKKELLSLV